MGKSLPIPFGFARFGCHGNGGIKWFLKAGVEIKRGSLPKLNEDCGIGILWIWVSGPYFVFKN